MNKRTHADIALRDLRGSDFEALAELLLASRTSMGLFEETHDVRDFRSFLAGLSVGCNIMVAERDRELAGFLSHTRGLISHLYVHPDHQRCGVGAALLDDALARYTAPFDLWCFEANTRARALYESRGFVAVEHNDGSRNAEGLADIRYVLEAI
ncbi:MAG: GNAT family N-acetyltransferase [Pseudomonadota bacterium]